MTVDISAQLHARNRFNVIFATWQYWFICPVINKNRAKNGTGCVFVGPRTRNQTNAAWSGLRPDTPPTSHAARLKSVSVRRFLTRQTENRGVPRLRRGFRFCVWRRHEKKHWWWWLVSRSGTNHLRGRFFVVHKIGGKACGCFVGKTLSWLLFLLSENRTKNSLLWRGLRARFLVYIL